MSKDPQMDLLKELISRPAESECLEFKAAKNAFDSDSFGRYVTALANEAADQNEDVAWLVFGIDDKTHEIVGSKAFDTVQKKNSAKLNLSQGSTPQVDIEFIDIHLSGSTLATIVKISRPNTAVAWKGHYYGRNGESIGALPIEKINRIGTPVDWSALPCAGATLESLDTEAIKLARSKFVERRPELKGLVEAESDFDFLSRLRAVVKGKVTNAAVVLFGKAESEALLSPYTSRITWNLRDHMGICKSFEHHYCPLIISVDKAIGCIRNLKYAHLEPGTMFPIETLQYEPWILRETLANAVAHQDYTKGAHITITESEEGEVSFSNSGTFIPGSIEAVLKSKEPESHIRNRLLVQVMIDTKMMENVSSGIQRMFLLQRTRLFPMPEYEITDSGVKVTIIGKIIHSDYAKLLAEDTRLTLFDLFLLDRLLRNKTLTRDQITHLRKAGLIAGRSPSFTYVATADERDFIVTEVVQKRLLEVLREKKLGATREFLTHLLDSEFPQRYTSEQKSHKIKNVLQTLRKRGLVSVEYRTWFYTGPDDNSSDHDVIAS